MGNSLPGKGIGVGVSGIEAGMTSCENARHTRKMLELAGRRLRIPARSEHLIFATPPSLEARRDANPDTKPAYEVGHCARQPKEQQGRHHKTEAEWPQKGSPRPTDHGASGYCSASTKTPSGPMGDQPSFSGGLAGQAGRCQPTQSCRTGKLAPFDLDTGGEILPELRLHGSGKLGIVDDDIQLVITQQARRIEIA